MSGPQPQQKKRRRRRSKKSAQQQHQDLWQLVPALPDPEPIRPSPDPRMVIRSLGDPPLAGQGAVAEHYIGAVVDRAAGLATALAAAAGLLADGDDEDDD
ncbi:MAG TPA: hypothetical protein VK007_04215 [Acidimicrobiales bacterium]|nr:hypothetical protein [Acidimicrobiales bacterium]